jgi:hypothetical protein
MPVVLRKLILSLFILSGVPLCAQELNCAVQVLSPQIQGTAEKKIFETLQTSVFEFMNNTKWTKDVFQLDERIECSITITISDKLSSDEFKGSIQVQSRRPVYKSGYNSTMFNWSDNDFQFKYLEYQAMDFSETTHMNNLTSVLAYYAYVILGIDYDSFSLNGGTPFFQKAQTIVSNAQNAPEKGWRAIESTKNRYWIIENMLNPTFSPLRECVYVYHRTGLDVLVSDKETGRATIAESLKLLKKVHSDRPGSFNLQLFFNAKSDELVNVFSVSFPDEKSRVVNILNEVDPANSNKYQKILQSQ